MKSIVQSNKECYICECRTSLEKHHIFFGTANRGISEIHGLTIWLCTKHHRDTREGVHFNKDLNLYLKQIGQQAFEKKYSHEKFIQEFGKNYL